MARQGSSTTKGKTKSPSSATAKTKAVKKTNPPPADNTLGLSDLHLRYAGLEKEHQKLLKQIKSKQTEIDRLTTQAREIMQEVAAKTMPLMQKLMEIDTRIHELFQEILTKRKFGQKSRRDIESIYQSLQRAGIISPKFDDDEDEDEDFDPEFEFEFQSASGSYYDRADEEENSQRYHSFKDLFNAAPKLDRDEQKKIRHIFLRLAEIFHPDKCLDHDRAEHYAEIMKEVNQAYANGDLAKLLAIEKQHQLGQEIDLNCEDSLARNCDRLEHQNSLLKTQYNNLKLELKEVKNSQGGSMAVEYRQIVKQGINPIDFLVEETQNKLDMITEIGDFIESFQQKRMTIKEFVKGPAVLQQMQRMALEQLLHDELFSIFDDDEEDC
jgi:hypothetical protein